MLASARQDDENTASDYAVQLAPDWEEVGKQIIANVTSEVNLIRNKALAAFDNSRSFMSKETIAAIYKVAFEQRDIILLVKVLQIQSVEAFDKSIKEILAIPFAPNYTSNKRAREIGLDVINELFGSICLREEYFDLAYNYFSSAMKNTFTGTTTKIPLLVKFNHHRPDLVSRHYLPPEAEENFFCLIKNYCEEFTDFEEAKKLVKSCEPLFDNFYFKLFQTFVKYPNAYERRMYFIWKQVELIPDEFKLELLQHVLDDRIFASNFDYISDYVKVIYLSSSANVQAKFEDYLLPKLTGVSYRSHLEHKIWANYLTYGKTAVEAVTLLLQFFAVTKPKQELEEAMMHAFLIDGFDFLNPESLTLLMDAMFKKIEIAENAFAAAKFLKWIYNKLTPEQQLAFQIRMTDYIKSLFSLSNTEECLFTMVDASFALNKFTPENALDEEFKRVIRGMIERTSDIISRLLLMHYSRDSSKLTTDEIKEFSKYIWYAFKIHMNLAIYLSAAEKKYLYETIYLFVCYKDRTNKGGLLEYLINNFHDLPAALQHQFFRSFVNCYFDLETPANEDFEHLFEPGHNEDEVQPTVKNLSQLSVRADKTIVAENARYIIENSAKKGQVTLLSYLDMFGDIPHGDLDNLAMLKSQEYIVPEDKEEKKEKQEKRKFVKNVWAATLFNRHYQAKVQAELMPVLPVASLVDIVKMYL